MLYGHEIVSTIIDFLVFKAEIANRKPTQIGSHVLYADNRTMALEGIFKQANRPKKDVNKTLSHLNHLRFDDDLVPME